MSLSNFDFVLKPVIKKSFKIETYGFDKIDLSTPSIFMPNHVSLLDPFILGTLLPKDIYFVANTEIAKKYSFFMKGRNVITIDQLNPYSIRKMIKLVKEGKSIVIFPEGRITTTGNLMEIFSGVSYIALKTGVKVYPIIIDGAERSKLSYLEGKLKRKLLPKIKIHIGDSFTVEKNESLSVKVQKSLASEMILHKLQNEKMNCIKKENVNLFNELVNVSKQYDKKKPIIEDINGDITYKNLILGSIALGNKLSTILNDEKNIGVLLPNSIGHVVTLFSLFRLGKTPAILNFSMGGQSLIECCETASLKTILTSKEFVIKGGLESLIDKLSENCSVLYLEDIKNSISTSMKVNSLLQSKFNPYSKHFDNTVILFTSGSESKPKGVVLSHENLLSNIQQAKTVIDFTSKDKLMNTLPMFHSFGLTAGTILPIIFNVPLYLYPTPLHYKIIPKVIYEKNATIMFGTSTFLEGYARNAHPYDFYSLRYVFAGAEKLKDEVRTIWAEKFGIRVFEGYGTTETAPILSLNTPLNYKKGTVGRFLPGIEYKLEKVEGIDAGGNLFVKGLNVMKGYLIHGKGFIPSGEWYDCGDIVEIDDEGYITIKSRLKRFAKVAGEMVSLNLVEQIANEVYEGSKFYSVNIPDKRKGERIILFTTNQELKDKKVIKDLKEYISEKKYSALLTPSLVIPIKTVPLLGSGKTDYVTLKEIASNYKEPSLVETVKDFFVKSNDAENQ